MAMLNTQREDSMWYYKTRIGTFWIVESEENHAYFVGMDEDSLGCYKRIEDAIRDIRHQETGILKWDESKNAGIPDDVRAWDEGEPENWDKF